MLGSRIIEKQVQDCIFLLFKKSVALFEAKNY